MLSYARGPQAEVLDLTLGESVRATAALYPNELALVSRHQGVRQTWSELRESCERVAAGLQSLGLEPTDRIGVWSTNCAEWIYLQYGAAMAGVILVNVNPAYRSHELSYVLKKSRLKYLFLHEKDARANYRDILNASLEGLDCELRGAIDLDSDEWRALLNPELPFEPPALSATDVVNIQYTSGTTGSPKGVLLTHRNIVNDGRFIAQRLRYTHKDRICIPVPLYHCFGCVIGTMSAPASGAAMILPAPSFDAKATLAAIHEERATSVYGVPAMFIAELSHPDFSQYDYTSLRTGVMAGSPCPIEVMKRVVNEMHASEICICYGQTECSPVNVMSEVTDSIEFRCATIGRTMPMTEIKLIDPATGETVEVGQQGELCARGFLVMAGYDADPHATAAVLSPDGWLRSGDLATMREDGAFRITGRVKDMILRGGENVYPREIEEFLYTHAKVAEVHVIGIPDERLGEVVSAWIRLKPGTDATEDEIKTYCQGRIAYFKIPAHIRFVESFPTTVTGKIQKFKMREQEIEERDLHRVAQTATA